MGLDGAQPNVRHGGSSAVRGNPTSAFNGGPHQSGKTWLDMKYGKRGIAASRSLWALLGSLGLLGCVSSGTNLKPGNVPKDRGALFGRIEVENQGKDVTGACYVALSDEAEHQKANLSLDRSGWLFTTVTRGETYLSTVMCTVGGFVKYNATFHSRALYFDVPGDGTIAYFGHVRINLRSEGSGVVGASLLGGGLGNGLASSGEGDDAQMQLRDGFAEAVLEYRRRYGQPALLVPALALAAEPTPAALPPASTAAPRTDPKSSDLTSDAAGFTLGGGIAEAETRCKAAQLVWQALDPDRATCSGTPLDLGLPMSVTLTARDGLLNEVAADANADGATWNVAVSRFNKLSADLVSRCGKHFNRKTEAIDDCSEDIKSCFIAGHTRTRMNWRGSNDQETSLTLSGASNGKMPSLWLRYGKATALQ